MCMDRLYAGLFFCLLNRNNAGAIMIELPPA